MSIGVTFKAGAVVAFALLLGQVDPAFGQPETEAQDPRIAEAQAACLANQLDKGLALLATLFAETQEGVWIFNQARCYQQNHRPQDARERFREFLRKSEGLDVGREDRARKFIAEIDAELGPKEPQSVPAQPSAWDIGREVAPPVRTDATGNGPSGLRVASYVAAGVGVLGLAGAALAATLQADRATEATKMAPPDQFVAGNRALSDNFDSGESLGMYAVIALITGSAALVTGGVLYWASAPSRTDSETGASHAISVGLAPVLAVDGTPGALLFGSF